MERSSTISSGRSCCELSRLLPFHSRLPRTRQGPLRVGSVRRAPCESKDCHRRTDLQEWELGGLMSCLLWPPCLLRSELQLRPPLSGLLPCLCRPSVCSQCESPDTDHQLPQIGRASCRERMYRPM